MTTKELEQAFERHSDEYIAFERIEKPAHRRPDVCAFLMLDAAVGGGGDMVACAEHDEIWLSVHVETLAAVATDELIRDLVRCGVRLDSDTDSLVMFV